MIKASRMHWHKHCRRIVPIYPSKRYRQTDKARPYFGFEFAKSCMPCHDMALLVAYRLGLGILKIGEDYCTFFFLSLGTSLTIRSCEMALKAVGVDIKHAAACRPRRRWQDWKAKLVAGTSDAHITNSWHRKSACSFHD